jgi:hypothetical protein
MRPHFRIFFILIFTGIGRVTGEGLEISGIDRTSIRVVKHGVVYFKGKLFSFHGGSGQSEQEEEEGGGGVRVDQFFFPQALDHFNATDKRKWKQVRYGVSSNSSL